MSDADLGFLLENLTRPLRLRLDQIVCRTSLTRSHCRTVACLAKNERFCGVEMRDTREIETLLGDINANLRPLRPNNAEKETADG